MASPTPCAPSFSRCSLRRYTSAIRTGCANQRPSGSVEWVVSNYDPYSDQQLTTPPGFLLQPLEPQHSIAWRDRVQPLHRHLPFWIIRTLPKIGEISEYKRYPLGLQHRVAIGQLQMQMCSSRIPAVAEKREHISSMNMVARSYFNASSLQMRISDETVLCNLKNDVVSCDVVQRNGRKNARSVVEKFIDNFRDLAIRQCKNWFTPTPPILVLAVPVVTSISV